MASAQPLLDLPALAPRDTVLLTETRLSIASIMQARRALGPNAALFVCLRV